MPLAGTQGGERAPLGRPFVQRAIDPLENTRHVVTRCKVGDEVGHFAVAANEAVHAHGDASQFLDPLSQPGAGVARADSL